jgi:predicted site-specific integrase-resolvase
MSMAIPTLEPLWTYQDIAAHFKVHVSTILRWMRKRKVKKVCPTSHTVRFPNSAVKRFIQQVENEKSKASSNR